MGILTQSFQKTNGRYEKKSDTLNKTSVDRNMKKKHLIEMRGFYFYFLFHTNYLYKK